MLPNYLVIGAPRCGTSWLARNLRAHPQVFMPHIKEVHFFDKNYDNGIDWYKKYFSGCNQIAVGEATPGYLYNKSVPELIHKHLPNCKLIVSLRDPVERAYSHYWYRIAEIKKQNKKTSFEEYLTRSPRLIDEGLYSVSLSRYYRLFRKENLLILRYEDIKLNPEGYMKEIFKFLNVDENYMPPYLTKVVNSSATRSESTLMHSISRKFSKLKFHWLSNMLDELYSKEIPSLSLEVRKKILEMYYLDDINKLENLIQQDLSLWKQ